MKIETFEKELENKPTESEKRIYCLDMFGHDLTTVLDVLKHYKSIGWTVIPCEGCTNKKPDGSCAGHEK